MPVAPSGISVGPMYGTPSADAGTIVNTNITGFLEKVETYISDAESVINEIRAAIFRGGAALVPAVSDADENIAFGAIAAPTLDAAAFATITIPALGALDTPDTSFSGISTKPTFTDTIPAFVDPGAVTPFSYTMPTVADPGDAPTTNSLTVPDAPVLTDPTEPSFVNITIPTLPTLSLPEWTRASAPAFTEIAPDATLDYTEVAYESTVLQELRDSLADWADIQTQFWNRARDKEAATWRRLDDEATRFGASGFSFPTGAAAARRLFAQQEASLKISDLNREAAIEQSKLTMQHLQTILGQMVQQDGQLMNYWTAQQNRLLEFAKASVQAVIDVFNIKVSAYNATIAGINAEVAVFNARLQAELAELEKTKIELEAQKLIGELNTQKLQLYQGQLQALQVKQSVYNGQLEGVKILADVERQKIELYREKVNAYSAKSQIEISKMQTQIEAKRLEYQGQESAIRGQTAKAEFVKASADVFKTRMDGWRTEIDSAKLKSDAVVAKNESTISAFRATLENVAKQIDYEVARVRAILDGNNTKIQNYTALAQTENLKVNSFVEKARVEIANMQKNLERAKTQTTEDNQYTLQQLSLTLNVLAQIKTMYGQLATAALNAINVSASLGESMGYSYGASQSYGEGTE